MANNSQVAIFVENSSDELVIQGIFADLVSHRLVDVRMSWTLSSAIGVAEMSLLKYPAQPVAIVANCLPDDSEDADESPEATRRSIEFILRNAAPRGAWHVALAIPDSTAWARSSREFSARLQAEEASVGPRNKHDIVVMFKDLVAEHAIDRAALANVDPEFAKLNQFVEDHVTVVAGTQP